MERNREARRGTMAASTEGTNDGGGGNVLSRRRHRNSSSFRDSPGQESPESASFLLPYPFLFDADYHLFGVTSYFR